MVWCDTFLQCMVDTIVLLTTLYIWSYASDLDTVNNETIGYTVYNNLIQWWTSRQKSLCGNGSMGCWWFDLRKLNKHWKLTFQISFIFNMLCALIWNGSKVNKIQITHAISTTMVSSKLFLLYWECLMIHYSIST